jgi:hypothetical protein
MATFESLFPTFLTRCAELHGLLLSVAFALFIVGVMVTVYHKFSHRVGLHLLVRLLVLTTLLVFLPVWGNQLQALLQSSLLSGLGVDPANVQEEFNRLLIIKRDQTTETAWWNILAQIHNFTTDLIISAVLMLVGWFASFLTWWAYIIQKIILNLGYALSPLLIGFMAIPALRQIGTRYLLNLVGVLLWPLGWAVAALITQGVLDFMTDPSFEYFDPTSTFPDLQKTIGVAIVGFWIIFSTFAAPIIIQKVIASGMLAGGALLSGGVQTAVQSATAAASGAAAGAALGIPRAAAVAATTGTLGLLSAASGTGHAGSFITAGGFGKRDVTGDKTVQQMLQRIQQRLDQMQLIPPVIPQSPKA